MTGPFEQIFAEFEKAEAFNRRVQRAITGLDVGQGAERDLLNLVGAASTPSELTMAHTPALKMAATLMCSVFQQAFTKLESPATTFYKLTVIDQVGIMAQQTPHLALPALQRAVQRAMNALNLSGIAFPRPQPVYDELFDTDDDALLLYGEALCWNAGHQEIWEIVDTLNDRLAGDLAIDVEAISLQPLPSDVISALCVLASFAGLPGFWWYLDGWPGEHYQFHESTLTFPIDKALRVAEALSHMRIHDAVFGVGEGLPLVDTWKRRLASWHDEQIYFVDTSIPREAVKIDVERLWQALRSWSPNYYHNPFTLE
jgi:hypothetical protein